MKVLKLFKRTKKELSECYGCRNSIGNIDLQFYLYLVVYVAFIWTNFGNSHPNLVSRDTFVFWYLRQVNYTLIIHQTVIINSNINPTQISVTSIQASDLDLTLIPPIKPLLQISN